MKEATIPWDFLIISRKRPLTWPSEEDTIKKAYIELGKLYYAEKGAAPEAAYAASCEKITAAKAAIEANNDRIAELKSSADDEVEVVARVEPVERAAEPSAHQEAEVQETEAQENPPQE